MRVIAAIAVLMLAGCGSGTDPKAREVAEWVLEKGGTVKVVDSQQEVSNKAELPKEDFGLAEIDLGQTDIKDEDLEKLRGLSHLRRLSLYRTGITDAGLDNLLSLGALEELELSYTGITDEAVSTLSRMRHLEKLYLYGTALTAEKVKELRSRLSGCTINL